MGTFIFIFIAIWVLTMTVLLTPLLAYSSAWDKLTQAKYRPDRVNLQIMLDNLRSYPEQWSVNRESVSFPREGSKQIYLNYDKREKSWSYTLSSFDDGPRPLNGHFGGLFASEISRLNSQKEGTALLRNFYKDLDTTLLLENYK